MKVFLVQTSITDNPDYQTFVNLFSKKEKAVDFVVEELNEAIENYGDEGDEINTTQLPNGNLRMEVDSGEVWFISEVSVG